MQNQERLTSRDPNQVEYGTGKSSFCMTVHIDRECCMHISFVLLIKHKNGLRVKSGSFVCYPFFDNFFKYFILALYGHIYF